VRRSVPLYTSRTSSAPHFLSFLRRRAIGGQGLGAIHFRSRSLRQVGCYTFHSGFQPSWPPTNSTEQTTAFRGSVDEQIALWAPHARFRFSPHHQYCLPVVAHLGPQRVSFFLPRQGVHRAFLQYEGTSLRPSVEGTDPIQNWQATGQGTTKIAQRSRGFPFLFHDSTRGEGGAGEARE